jgi:hypothetical protein
MAKEAAFKLPKTLAACADLLYSIRESRLALNRQAEELETQEKLIKEHLINTLPKSEASGVAGKLARVTIVTKLVPQTSDSDALHAYIKKTGDWDLLQGRLSDKAVRLRWEAGKTVPGVEAFQTVSVSINKVK